MSSYGIEATFVEIDINDLLFTATIILGLLFVAWTTVGLVPMFFISKLLILFYLFWPVIILSLIASYLFSYFGFAWGTLFAFLLVTFLVSLTISEIRREMHKGESFWDAYKPTLASELEMDDKTLRSQLTRRVPYELYVLLLAFLISAQSVGPMVGKYAARKMTSYHSISNGASDYLVVASFNDGFVVAGYHRYDEDSKTAQLTFDTSWISLPDLSKQTISRVKISEFTFEEINLNRISPSRVTFEDFVKRVQFWK